MDPLISLLALKSGSFVSVLLFALMLLFTIIRDSRRDGNSSKQALDNLLTEKFKVLADAYDKRGLEQERRISELKGEVSALTVQLQVFMRCTAAPCPVRDLRIDL